MKNNLYSRSLFFFLAIIIQSEGYASIPPLQEPPPATIEVVTSIKEHFQKHVIHFKRCLQGKEPCSKTDFVMLLFLYGSIMEIFYQTVPHLSIIQRYTPVALGRQAAGTLISKLPPHVRETHKHNKMYDKEKRPLFLWERIKAVRDSRKFEQQRKQQKRK